MILRVADLVKGVNKGTPTVELECNVEFDHCLGGCIAETLPVGWNAIPGMLD